MAATDILFLTASIYFYLEKKEYKNLEIVLGPKLLVEVVEFFVKTESLMLYLLSSWYL
jgi:hypothetical protein